MRNLKQLINQDIRPQDDFYRHVNDKWLSTTEIPPDEGKWSNFHELVKTTQAQLHTIVKELIKNHEIKPGSIEQKVRDFYLSGNDDRRVKKSGLEFLEEQFRSVDECEYASDLIGLIGSLHLRGGSILWRVYVDQDEVDSSRYLLRVRQSGLSLPDRDYYDLGKTKMKKLKAQLVKHIPGMFKKAGYDEDEKIGEEVYDFETELTKYSRSSTDLRDVENNYNKMTFNDLQSLTPAIDWTAYFKGLGIVPPEFLSVDQPEFFEFINEVFTEFDVALLRKYIKWHTLKNLSMHLGEDVATANFEFYGRALQGTDKMRPRWKRRIITIDSCIGEALGKLYVDKHFPPEAKERMELLVTDLKAAFAKRIEKLEWMEPDTKKYALKKLHNIYVKVGYPKKMQTYEDLEITHESYIKNIVESEIYELKSQLRKLGQPVDREEWYMTPPTVNAYFSPNTNEITFPAGILQPPFFDREADDAVNYGGIGMVIGHELTHGFDDQGSLFDAEGNLKNWRSEKDKKEFDKRKKVMVKQADNFEVLKGHKLNGELTLGENIADVGGAEIAFQALKLALSRNGHPGSIEGYSPQERFFLNFARGWREKIRDELALQYLSINPHSPGEFRTNNTLCNMDVFYETFGVKPDDKMSIHKNDRANIW